MFFFLGVEEGETVIGFLLWPWQLDQEEISISLLEHPADVHDHIIVLALLEQHCSQHQQILIAHFAHLLMDGFKFAIGLL